MILAFAPAALPQTCPPEIVIPDDCLVEIRPNAARNTPPFTNAANLPAFHARLEGQLQPPSRRLWSAAWVMTRESPLYGKRIYLFGNVSGGAGVDDPAEKFLLFDVDSEAMDPRSGAPFTGQGGYGVVKFESCPPLIS